MRRDYKKRAGNWWLINGAERNLQYPETFPIPPESERVSLKPGDDVKLGFETEPGSGGMGFSGERMWVKVREAAGHKYVGELISDPVVIDGLHFGDQIAFLPEHVIDIWLEDMPAEQSKPH